MENKIFLLLSTLVSILVTEAASEPNGVLVVVNLERDAIALTNVPVPYLPGTKTDQPPHQAGNVGLPVSNSFNSRERFHLPNSDGAFIDAVMTTTSLIFLKGDTSAEQVSFHGRVPFEEGCSVNYLHKSHLGQFAHVLFESGPPECAPLRVNVSSEHLNTTTRLNRELTGKKVIALDGYDPNGDVDTFLVYINDAGDGIRILDKFEYSQRVDNIGQCDVIIDINPLRSKLSTNGTLEMVIDCLDQFHTARRYLLSYDSETSDVTDINKENGHVLSSRDGDYLAIVYSNDDHYSLAVYATAHLLRTPAQASYDTPIEIKFLQTSTQTVLVVYEVGRDVELINADLFVSTQGDQGSVVVPNTLITSCSPCPAVEIVAEQFVMFSVLDDHFYDARYMMLGSDDTATSRIPSITSDQPHLLTFLETPPIPSTTSDRPIVTTTGGTDEKPAIPVLAIGSTVGIVVFVFAVVVAVVCSYAAYRYLKTRRAKSNRMVIPTIHAPTEMSPQTIHTPTEAELMSPLDVERDNGGQPVLPDNRYVRPPYVTQEEGSTSARNELASAFQHPGLEELLPQTRLNVDVQQDGGYITSSSSASSPHPTPIPERYGQPCTDTSSLGSDNSAEYVHV